MPKLKPDAIPSYRLHKQSGQAIVTLNGRDILLGTHGSAESRERYNRAVGEWQANGRRLKEDPAQVTVDQLILDYWKHAVSYYPAGNGGELASIKIAMPHVRRLYGGSPITSFGPLAMKAVRESMLKAGWSRKYINGQVGRVKRMFRWAVENEIAPRDVWYGLQAVPGLRKGRSTARENEPVKCVSEDHAGAIYPFVSRQVQTMIRLQLVTGMRPGEVCRMRTGDIDTNGAVWVYKPSRHKSEQYNYTRDIFIGPKGQTLLRPFLKPELQAFIFSPEESEAERRRKLAAEREAREANGEVPAGYGNRPGTNRVKDPKRSPGDRYDVAAYRKAIERGCDLAWPAPAELGRQRIEQVGVVSRKTSRWETRKEHRQRLGSEAAARLDAWREQHRFHPHQLRHTAATRLRREFGLEATQVILGHQELTTTQIYAEADVEAAVRVMASVG
jgi:integrase